MLLRRVANACLFLLAQTAPTSWACLAGQGGVMLHTRLVWGTLRATGSTASGRARRFRLSGSGGVANESMAYEMHVSVCSRCTTASDLVLVSRKWHEWKQLHSFLSDV